MKIIVGLGNPGSKLSVQQNIILDFGLLDKIVKQSSLKYKAGKGEYILAKDGQ